MALYLVVITASGTRITHRSIHEFYSWNGDTLHEQIDSLLQELPRWAASYELVFSTLHPSLMPSFHPFKTAE